MTRLEELGAYGALQTPNLDGLPPRVCGLRGYGSACMLADPRRLYDWAVSGENRNHHYLEVNDEFFRPTTSASTSG